MAGEPARTLLTRRLPDQITSSSAIPDEDDSRRAMAVTAAVAAAIPAAIEGVLNGAVRRNELSLVVKHRLQTELITALDKATKDACAPFTMDGAMRDDGERGSVAGAAGSADITAILSLDWAKQDWFDKCDDVDALDTCFAREIRYFSHTYQSRFTMLLQCNTALN